MSTVCRLYAVFFEKREGCLIPKDDRYINKKERKKEKQFFFASECDLRRVPFYCGKAKACIIYIYFKNQNAEIFSHFYSFAIFVQCLRRRCLLQRGEYRNTVGLIMDLNIYQLTLFSNTFLWQLYSQITHKIQNYSSTFSFLFDFPLNEQMILVVMPYNQGAIC